MSLTDPFADGLNRWFELEKHELEFAFEAAEGSTLATMCNLDGHIPSSIVAYNV